MNRRVFGMVVVAAFASLVAAVTRGADRVSNALAVPITASWTGLPLRMTAARLADAGRIAVVVDRRLDPDVLVSLESAGDPLADVLARVAGAAGAEVAVYAGHLRIVPPGRAARLAFAEDRRTAELRALSVKLRSRLTAADAWTWPDGAVPRELVAAVAAEAHLALAHLDSLPHDHFPGARLVPLPVADRIDLVLAHFDRRVAWRPVPAEAPRSPTFTILPLEAADERRAAAAARPGRPDPEQQPAVAAATYSLTVAAPLDELLTTLARRFSLDLDLDREGLAAIGVAPGEIVRLEMRDASRDRLLEAVLAPRGLAWRIEDGRLVVNAAPR